MPVHVVQINSLETERSYERSPVVSVVTDVASEADLPAEVRAASDRVVNDGLSLMRDCKVPKGSDAALMWMAGDRLVDGSAAVLRRSISIANGRVFFPIHFPCTPDFDLIALQPRIWKNGSSDSVHSSIRVSAGAQFSPGIAEFIEESREDWARLYRAVTAAEKDPERSVHELSAMWRESSVMHPVYRGLLVRDLIVLQFRQNKTDHAERLIRVAMDVYPRYAEILLLAAWMALQQGNIKKASRCAGWALENPDRTFVGSIGADSYRAHWLQGLAAEFSGEQGAAIQNYVIGTRSRPAFPRSVYGLLRQRLSRRDAEDLSYGTLVPLVHREPQYSEMAFHFFLLHGQMEPARRLLSFPRVPNELKEKLQPLFDEASASRIPRPRAAGAKPGVRLTGPFYVYSSLARINREIAGALTAAGDFEVGMEPASLGSVLGSTLPHHEAVSKGFKHRLSRLDLTLRLQWPPDFDSPPSGKLVCILPWEFHSIPQSWVRAIKDKVDELWVLSQFNREVFTRNGVSRERVHVIPCGVDAGIFQPEGPVWRPEGCRNFIFLFVGGAIFRKGADLLWNAYAKAFSSADDVTLVVKDMGASTFYTGQSLAASMRKASHQPRAPHLMVLSEDTDDAKLASLYRGSNMLVLPYRGEGFGLPLAESLACGRPVITTSEGPAREFCPPEASYFVPAKMVEFPSAESQLGPMTGPLAGFEPDLDALATSMRYAFDHPEEISRGALAASEKVRSALNWERITGLMIERIRLLASGG